MNKNRFNVFRNNMGKWLIEDIVEDKYLVNIPQFIGFDDEKSANVFCEELNSLNEENQSFKRIIKEILWKTESELSYSTPICQITVQVDQRIYKTFQKMLETKREGWYYD